LFGYCFLYLEIFRRVAGPQLIFIILPVSGHQLIFFTALFFEALRPVEVKKAQSVLD
jgi:hypothetical protein